MATDRTTKKVNVVVGSVSGVVTELEVFSRQCAREAIGRSPLPSVVQGASYYDNAAI